MPLIPGKVSDDQFNLLLDLTRINGTEVITALYDHLVLGAGKAEAYRRHNVNVSQFSRRLKAVHAVSAIVEKLSVFYLPGASTGERFQ